RRGPAAGEPARARVRRAAAEARFGESAVRFGSTRTRMSNVDVARRLIDNVRALGVVDFCVCSGSRNAPLIAVMKDAYSFVDERSAAFFAVGRARRDERPVAVITTSGTAVAELLPAAVEAYYSGVPLVLITADRPARYRGTGAPQAIEQEAIFGVYASRDASAWTGEGPLHINIEFDEPLIDEECHPERSEGSVWVG